MRQNLHDIVKGMDIKDMENRLVFSCAPLIAGLKVSNLLTVGHEQAKKIGELLKPTEISWFELAVGEEKSVLLLSRASELETYLSRKTVRRLLKESGYSRFGMQYLISAFRERYQAYLLFGGSFPHEMGLFLGYPIEDVEGFIKNDGKNFLYSGYWKVYADTADKIKIFEKYESARMALAQLRKNGVGALEIIEMYSESKRKRTAI